MAEHALHVTVTVDADELREWAGRHADAGHHGVAHVLYKAAEGVESITEQHDREVAAKAWDEGYEAGYYNAEDYAEGFNIGARITNPYREGGAS